MNLTKKEVKAILIASFVIAIVFAFNDKKETFEISAWLLNFVLTLFAALISVLFYNLLQKFAAERYGGSTTYKLWTIRKIWPAQMREFRPIPIGIILGFFTTLFSNGRVFFLAIHSPEIETSKYRHVHPRFKHITEFEIAKIAIMGPLAHLILGLFLNVINPASFANIIQMNYYLAIYHLIPFSSLDGLKIFMGSRLLYLFTLALTVFCVVLASLIPTVQAVFIALIFAIMLLLIFLHKVMG
ncbi:MAG: hypothetical protein PHE43_00160 [Candidatus Nanoarchaeia archaeon]|nr:hypothetical protein [Candidatus Nanoarchaeia archaeon]